MSVTIMAVQWCTTCRSDRSFEQPLCGEGHGADCPEWFCADCGVAVVLATSAGVEVAVVNRSAA